MKVYAESSALLAWLLDEPKTALTVADVLAKAETIFVSELAIVECRRVIHRVASNGILTRIEANRLREALGRSAAHWMRSAITADILEAASGPFPVEPVRTLDAIHLATAIRTRRAIPDLCILTLDKRIRANGEALGFPVC